MTKRRVSRKKDVKHYEGFTQGEIEAAGTKLPLGFQALDKLNTGFKRGELQIFVAVRGGGHSKLFPNNLTQHQSNEG